MSSETPILELKIKSKIMLNKSAQLITQSVKIERVRVKQKQWESNNAFNYNKKQIKKLPSYIKYLLHDFILQTTYKKSCYISYIYMNIKKKNTGKTSYDTSYICYDAISAKYEQDIKETIAPASFVEVDKTSSPFVQVDTIFEILKKSKKIKDSEKTKEVLKFVEYFLEKCAHVRINAEFIKIHNENDEYNFIIDQEIKFFRYPWGEHLLVLPVPELPEPGKSPKHGQLLGVRSCKTGKSDAIWDNVWKSLEKLNSILRTPGKKKIFIKGEPGSGKEVFANAIHYGSVRSRPDKLVVRSVAGASTKELRELLFGREIDGVNIAGLIEKADGGTLFLDEFDKIKKPDFYAELLRVLEAGEYVPVNGKKTRKVGDVNWIFAGAFMGTDSSKPITDLPHDFWSRLTSLIDIKNPIIPGQKNGYSYAGLIFLYFFIQEVVEMGEDVECVTSDGKGDYRSHIARLFININQKQELLKVDVHLINQIMKSFQAKKYSKYGDENAGINNGQYFWSGKEKKDDSQDSKEKKDDSQDSKEKKDDSQDSKEKKDDSQDNRCQEEKNTYWSHIKKTATPCEGYDNVRSIGQAAKVAFARCFNAALGLKEPSKNTFWPNNKNKNENDEIYKAIKEAVETVFITRPGNNIEVRGKKTGAKG